MKDKRSLIIFIIAIIIVSVLRIWLVYDMPIAANVALGIDDALMISMTKSITEGNWIGEYGDAVISKGVTFPLVLAFCYATNIDYITMITILYILACLCLIIVLSKKIKNKFALFFIYVITLFTPIMYSYQVMQRVYRNSLIPSFSIMIVSGYIYLFLTRNDEKYYKRIIVSILTGIVLALFWYAREDSIWMIPFILFTSVSLLIGTVFKNKKITKDFFKNLLIILIPIALVFCYKNIISYQNYKHFGVYTVYNNESYNKAMKSLRKVKKYDYYDNIDFTTKKLQKVAEVATSLSQIHPRLIELIYGYSLIDSGPQDGEVVNGWFPWALKGTLSEYGYYNDAKNTNAFFDTLHYEIENALENGTLEKEDIKPDIVNDINKVFYQVLQTFKALYRYDDIYFNEVTGNYNNGFDKTYRDFAKFTNNKFIVYEEDENVSERYFENVDNYENEIETRVGIINQLISSYKNINIVIFSLGAVLYCIYSIITIIEIFKKKFYKLEMWVIISGILGAMLTLVFGIAYETAFNANVITAMYLSGVYPLMIIFAIIMIYQMLNIILEYIKIKKQKKLVDRVEIKEEKPDC